MAEQSHYLTDAEVATLSKAINLLKRRVTKGELSGEDPLGAIPSTRIAKLKDCDSIPAISGNTPGQAQCHWYRLEAPPVGGGSRTLVRVDGPDDEAEEITVFNIYKREFRPSGYFQIQREAFGAWLCERPAPSGDHDSSCDSTCAVDEIDGLPISDLPEKTPADVSYFLAVTTTGACLSRVPKSSCT